MILPHRAYRGPSPLVLAACLLQLGMPACSTDPERLVLGAQLTHELSRDRTHSYTVDLNAGDFLRITVDQKGIDVAVELRGPDDRLVALVDGPGPVPEHGTEDLAAIAAHSGIHTLQVRGGIKNEPRAGYHLRVVSLRPARADDRRRVEAVLANQEATNAMGGPGDTRPRQAALREKALGLWRGLGETAREADTLFQLGLLRSSLGQADQAAPLFQRAEELYAAAGDTVAQAKLLNPAGLLGEKAGDADSALADYLKALDLARRAGARQPLVNALTNAARLLNWKGRRQEALNDLQEALRLSAGLTCDGCQGGILIGLGSAYDDLGDTQKAVSHYKEALKRQDLPRPDQGAALNNLGLDALALGDAEKALESFERAATITAEPAVLFNQGIALERLSRLDEAFVQYTRALGLARRSRNLRTQIGTLYSLGNLALKRGRKAEAFPFWRELLTLAQGHTELEPVALFTRGITHRESGDLAAARADLLGSLRLSRDRGDRGWESICGMELAQLERKGGDFRQALAYLEAAIEIVESQRNQIRNPDLRATYLGARQRFYELSIATLMDLHRRHPAAGWNVKALRASEQARARGLLDLLAEIRADLRTGVDPRRLEQEAELRAEINARDLRRQELRHQGASREELARADQDLEESLSDFEDAENELRKSNPAYAALTQPQPLDAAAIQSRVLAGEDGEGVLLLEYSLGEEKSYLWAVSPTAVHSFELPARRKIETLALDAYDKMTQQDADPAAADAAALAISRTILGPVEALLTGGTLLVVSDGMLQYIPFAALPLPTSSDQSPGERLINRQRVVSLPSASTLAVLRDELRDRPPPPKTLAILAHPVFRRDDPRLARVRRADRAADTWSLEELPWSEDEARAIAGMVPDPRQKLLALGFDASVGTVLQGRLGDFRYVHFATHGFLDNMRPQMSSLALSRFDREGRALEIHDLRLQDIYNLQLNADLVVLSACQTALGKEVRGEGLMGLTRGFMYAGSARVLASLWSVEDRATSKLMEKFYRHLLGERLPPAEALRRAQLDLASTRRWSKPYYWAGFSLQGEWR